MNRRNPSMPLPGATRAPSGIAPVAAVHFGRTQRFERAIELMQDGCWHDAFDALAELADDGHAQAARLALLFVHRGARLFGGCYKASGNRREAWLQTSD
jgi:hypothetical protein